MPEGGNAARDGRPGHTKDPVLTVAPKPFWINRLGTPPSTNCLFPFSRFSLSLFRFWDANGAHTCMPLSSFLPTQKKFSSDRKIPDFILFCF